MEVLYTDAEPQLHARQHDTEISMLSPPPPAALSPHPPFLTPLFINNFNIVQSGSKQETLLF